MKNGIKKTIVTPITTAKVQAFLMPNKQIKLYTLYHYSPTISIENKRSDFMYCVPQPVKFENGKIAVETYINLHFDVNYFNITEFPFFPHGKCIKDSSGKSMVIYFDITTETLKTVLPNGITKKVYVYSDQKIS